MRSPSRFAAFEVTVMIVFPLLPPIGGKLANRRTPARAEALAGDRSKADQGAMRLSTSCAIGGWQQDGMQVCVYVYKRSLAQSRSQSVERMGEDREL
mmetsp:Transcript_60229/g.127583  ORF Transcript_60229/g.127583 Transcript_60229/m.127583 type:complete len:97 (+) Transcript_60229:769-1059(+)